MKKKSIIYTNDHCIGCNKCIKACSVMGACISIDENGKARIEVDGNRCVACGSCLDVCVHDAREFEDDTERFFEDLKNGMPVSLLLAPAFKANYPDEYESVLGGLKKLGARRIISVSFGADICTWGYLNYIEKNDFTGGISQPCPAVVSYIERYMPKLLPKLFPVQSPLMCAAIYARKELGITDRFAFISPCIAKKIEIEDPHNKGLVQYNVTFSHLMRYVREHGISGPPVHSEIEYGLGSFYPTPGGLAENIRWFLGDHVFIRQIEGERRLYEWLHQNALKITDEKNPYFFIDALNCEKGCICGTAVEPEKSGTDDALFTLFQIREQAKKQTKGGTWSEPDTPLERLKQFNKQFAGLALKDYLRGYTDHSAECSCGSPSEDELEAVFISMNKFTKESREIDCTCCGYESCVHMATAVYHGFNHKENCIYYEKTMVDALGSEKAVAEEATRAKSAFLANMSHEIRTPINAVLGMNEMILRESAEPEVLEYSENIRSAGNTLLGLVNNILDFSKIEAGKLEIEPVEYDLSSVLNDLVNMIQIKADEKGLELLTEFDTNIPKLLYGDEVRIKQVITNLLTNAVKYTEKGCVRFRLSYEEIIEETDSILLHVEVEDTGIGIKTEDMEKLFSEFERIEEKRNRNIEGTGLGMNITKRLLEMMGSSLKVTSVYGQGTCFGFSLKQRVMKREALGDYEAAYRTFVMERERDGGRFVAPDAKILVVDDNEMNLAVFKNLLARTLIQIDLANDGFETLEMVQKKKYDMIFLDHMMPEKDGIETLHEMRAKKEGLNEKTPVVCLTANAISGAREKYLAEGFKDYLTKPIISSRLEELLIKYLPGQKIQIRGKGSEEPRDNFGGLDDGASMPVADDVLMKEAYEEIHTAAQAMDHERLEAVFSRIKDYKIPKEEEELFHDLKEAAEQFDHETVLKLMENDYMRRELTQITEALENQQDKGGAIWLRQEEFAYIYCFMVRYMKRYQMVALKVLLFLHTEKEGERKEEVEAFGRVLQKTLRRSDIILQTGKRQFFLFLPALLEQHFPSVVRRIMQAWGQTGYEKEIEIRYVVEVLDYR